MGKWLPGSAYIVVVAHGLQDLSRTAWPSAAEAERYIERLRREGVPTTRLRLYRRQVVEPPSCTDRG